MSDLREQNKKVIDAIYNVKNALYEYNIEIERVTEMIKQLSEEVLILDVMLENNDKERDNATMAL